MLPVRGVRSEVEWCAGSSRSSSVAVEMLLAGILGNSWMPLYHHLHLLGRRRRVHRSARMGSRIGFLLLLRASWPPLEA